MVQRWLWMIWTMLIVASTVAEDGPPLALTFTPVVIEAFVSEGCRHSPPVIEVLNHVAARARSEDAPVYVLSYHVEYWNHLGWEDSFAREAHDQRQKAVADILRQPALRTPLVVINGNTLVSRSGLPQIMHLINNALGVEPVAGIAVTDLDHDQETVQVAMVMRGVTTDSRVHVALVERALASQVTGGDNKGQRLVHQGTVRDLVLVPAPEPTDDNDDPALRMTTRLDFPQDADPAHLQVVAFLQDPVSLRIFAAHGRDLTPPQAPETESPP